MFTSFVSAQSAGSGIDSESKPGMNGWMMASLRDYTQFEEYMLSPSESMVPIPSVLNNETGEYRLG